METEIKPSIEFFCADNIEKLKDFPDNSFDAIATDCPYGLGKEPDALEVLRDWVEKGYHEVKSKGGGMGRKWDSFVPQPLFWKEAFRVLKPGGYVAAFWNTLVYDFGVMAMRLAGFEIRDQVAWMYGGNDTESLICSRESIVLARRPLIGTVAENTLTHGTGGINIDACRIPINPIADASQLRTLNRSKKNSKNGWGMNQKKGDTPQVVRVDGRFPANILFTHHENCIKNDSSYKCVEKCPIRILDEQSGITTSGKVKNNKEAYTGNSMTGFLRGKSTTENQHGDSGGASRFFFSTPSDSVTDKPINLIRYIVRLICPPGGECLDLFTKNQIFELACKKENITLTQLAR